MDKFDFTLESLRPKVLHLTTLNGYDVPSSFLNDLLKRIKSFDDDSFTDTFYLNIQHLCEQYADKFWNGEHRRDIINWLEGSGIRATTSLSDGSSVSLFAMTFSQFPKYRLKEVFYPVTIELFHKIETHMFANGFFNKDGVWNKEKMMLVSLILILQQKKYLKQDRTKDQKNNRLIHRHFFEKRYGIDLSKQMQAQQIKKYNLPGRYVPELNFITEPTV